MFEVSRFGSEHILKRKDFEVSGFGFEAEGFGSEWIWKRILNGSGSYTHVYLCQYTA